MADQRPQPNLDSRKVTPPQLARRWGVSADKVLTFIRSGELPAMNLAMRQGGRPRYRIDEGDIADFELRRTVQASPPKARSGRRKRPNEVIEFF